ncbi:MULTISPECIES: DUF4148 domain-containing protein [Paraburkholderia]|uniref:DUF4148 domain-containing protein n=1 Tax=Paraburkholderia TaxID=1822464 RepID=UPI0022539D6C|nr:MULTISPECIES: DUF4148 domain-containing protein [Paraburkholderia]MCX4160974.1 DUF4148 domain-containing protein [Paraburkholderia megapolitana]MDN7156470.1 DUF4148 domain-containing protein [Paraburkholderia sp. CHISQ3]MDQ6493515.1 DUF4148 domain-containing protein [Paraburkholderia megapolitana]
MKAIALLNRTVLTTLLVSASISAFAGGGSRGPEPRPYAHVTAKTVAAVAGDTTTTDVAAPGKTREQVRAELLQAEEAGLIPTHRNDYPPSAETIARNRVRFQQIEQAWQGGSSIALTQK